MKIILVLRTDRATIKKSQFSELSKVRGLPISSLAQEVHDLQQALRDDESAGVSWNLSTVANDKTLLLPILLVCFMQAGQQLSGINAVSNTKYLFVLVSLKYTKYYFY